MNRSRPALGPERKRGDGTRQDEAAFVEQAAEREAVVVPVVEEELEVGKRTVETGGVRVRKVVREREETVRVPLTREEVEVQRVAVNRVVDGDVAVRYEGDVMIVPVVEEVLVVEKRRMLREELHITRRRHVQTETQRISLRGEEATVERLEPGGDGLHTEDAALVEETVNPAQRKGVE
jgi:uncharacterized protein (TIGR02271 family)